MPYGHPISTQEDRLLWLRDRPELWEKVKLNGQACLHGEDHVRIAQAMKDAGLFSRSTYVRDIRVPRYIQMLRVLG